jgi:hypothetical protein
MAPAAGPRQADGRLAHGEGFAAALRATVKDAV